MKGVIQMVESKVRKFEDFCKVITALETRIDDYIDRVYNLDTKEPGYANTLHHYRSKVDEFQDRIDNLYESFPKFSRKYESFTA